MQHRAMPRNRKDPSTPGHRDPVCCTMSCKRSCNLSSLLSTLLASMHTYHFEPLYTGYCLDYQAVTRLVTPGCWKQGHESLLFIATNDDEKVSE